MILNAFFWFLVATTFTRLNNAARAEFRDVTSAMRLKRPLCAQRDGGGDMTSLYAEALLLAHGLHRTRGLHEKSSPLRDILRALLSSISFISTPAKATNG